MNVSPSHAMIPNVNEIRRAVREGKVVTRFHASLRMDQRKILYSEVLKVILEGQVIETYPQTHPFPSLLMMGLVREKEPLYVLCSFDGETCYIITVHWYDPQRWIDPWTRRRQK